MQFLVLIPVFICFLLLMPGLAENEDRGAISLIALNKSTSSVPIVSPGLNTSFSTLSLFIDTVEPTTENEDTAAISGIALNKSTVSVPVISPGLNSTFSTLRSSLATSKPATENDTTDLQTVQNISSTEESGIPLDVFNITAHNDSMIPKIAKKPSGSSDDEVEASSAVYYLQVILITLCTMAVVFIAVHLTKQLTKSSFRRKFRSSGRRGTIGKRYSDISLQLLNRESNILDLPNISEEGESHVVAGKAEVVESFVKENDSPMRSPPLTPTTENGSLKSADGVWL